MNDVPPPISAGMSQQPPTTLKKRLNTFTLQTSESRCKRFYFLPFKFYCLFLLQVVVQVKPVYNPPQLLPFGKETITYIATDLSGNQANCSFTVTVIGELIQKNCIKANLLRVASGVTTVVHLIKRSGCVEQH